MQNESHGGQITNRVLSRAEDRLPPQHDWTNLREAPVTARVSGVADGMSIDSFAGGMTMATKNESGDDEVARLRSRVRELESELASSGRESKGASAKGRT